MTWSSGDCALVVHLVTHSRAWPRAQPDGTLRWTQPELALYDIHRDRGHGYPDLVSAKVRQPTAFFLCCCGVCVGLLERKSCGSDPTMNPTAHSPVFPRSSFCVVHLPPIICICIIYLRSVLDTKSVRPPCAFCTTESKRQISCCCRTGMCT